MCTLPYRFQVFARTWSRKFLGQSGPIAHSRSSLIVRWGISFSAFPPFGAPCDLAPQGFQRCGSFCCPHFFAFQIERQPSETHLYITTGPEVTASRDAGSGSTTKRLGGGGGSRTYRLLGHRPCERGVCPTLPTAGNRRLTAKGPEFHTVPNQPPVVFNWLFALGNCLF